MNKLGGAIFEVKGQSGRNNTSKSFEEKALFLNQFFDKALSGMIPTAEGTRKAFIKKLDKKKRHDSKLFK